MHSSNVTLAEALAVQADTWFRQLYQSHKDAPRTFTGVSRACEQFITILEEVAWTRSEHIQRRAFLHWLCRKEDVAAYAYGGLWGLEDGSYMIKIFADDGEDTVEVTVPIVNRDDGASVYDQPQVNRWKTRENVWSPYTRLMEPGIIKVDDIDAADEVTFEKWWTTLRPRSSWRKVSDEYLRRG